MVWKAAELRFCWKFLAASHDGDFGRPNMEESCQAWRGIDNKLQFCLITVVSWRYVDWDLFQIGPIMIYSVESGADPARLCQFRRWVCRPLVVYALKAKMTRQAFENEFRGYVIVVDTREANLIHFFRNSLWVVEVVIHISMITILYIFSSNF